MHAAISTLWHASWMVQLYDHLTSECGTEIVVDGWKAAGIFDAVNLGSKGLPPLDPFCELDPQEVEIPDQLAEVLLAEIGITIGYTNNCQ